MLVNLSHVKKMEIMVQVLFSTFENVSFIVRESGSDIFGAGLPN